MSRALRPLLVVTAVVLAAFGYVHLAENKGYALKKGTTAPPFRLPAVAGGEVDLQSLRGRVVVLNFWATWCPPCVEELPSLERLHRALGKEGLSVVSVSVDEDEGVLRRFVTEHKLTFPVLRDPGGRLAAGAYRTTGYPETFELDAEGIVREHIVGPSDWATPEVFEHFRKRLSPASAAR
jgi:peroxiredoxin